MTRPQVTHRTLVAFPGVPAIRIWSYDKLLRARSLPRATWIFTDMDRLSPWELELAAHVYRELRSHGQRVLNDPARVCHRHALLKRLKSAGINRFDVWRIDESESVDRWPVFLRTESAHRGPLTGLIEDAGQLRLEIEKAVNAGYPERDLMVVEYCAEPVHGNLFRKLATFRVGDRLVPTLAVHDNQWAAKYGQLGVAGTELYREELAGLAENRYADALNQAFEIGHVEYGRADFALVSGAPQIYEINTNPTIGRVLEHPDPVRVESGRLWEGNFVAALVAIDTPSGAPTRIKDRILAKQRRRDFWMTRSRWVV
ncbi:MAG: hypothetical protein PHR30_13990 [Gallionellaceae bacterium]|nr:hypothetical protein [Gallionellaceae bacterium]MDD5366444.1 hypothetical protein [Gallionellaceae bacterium]